MAMSVAIIIPARMASTRLPDKPLADIAGLPMIVQVMRRAEESGLGQVIIACDGEAIASAVRAHGGVAVITDADLPSGSDRIWAALTHSPSSFTGEEPEIIINLQGDLPTFDGALLPPLVRALCTSGADIATLITPITRGDEHENPSVVKAVVALDEHGKTGRALYFTRCCAPHGEGVRYHHIGVYAYRYDALKRFVGLPPSPLEQREKLEQLRALEAGMQIAVLVADTMPLGVDTLEDLARARAMLT
jgi:3-deoxy-manno-octulosonate cytidylyltransferase (CMP-KDO synthetase)